MNRKVTQRLAGVSLMSGLKPVGHFAFRFGATKSPVILRLFVGSNRPFCLPFFRLSAVLRNRKPSSALGCHTLACNFFRSEA